VIQTTRLPPLIEQSLLLRRKVSYCRSQILFLSLLFFLPPPIPLYDLANRQMVLGSSWSAHRANDIIRRLPPPPFFFFFFFFPSPLACLGHRPRGRTIVLSYGVDVGVSKGFRVIGLAALLPSLSSSFPPSPLRFCSPKTFLPRVFLSSPLPLHHLSLSLHSSLLPSSALLSLPPSPPRASLDLLLSSPPFSTAFHLHNTPLFPLSSIRLFSRLLPIQSTSPTSTFHPFPPDHLPPPLL